MLACDYLKVRDVSIFPERDIFFLKRRGFYMGASSRKSSNLLVSP